MNPRRLLGLATLVAAGMLPAAAGAAGRDAAPAAAPVATTAPVAYPTPSGAWPAEWPALADYTATISLAVPSTWRQMELMPALNDDGSPRPWLAATTDMAAFLPEDGQPDSFSVPGVVFLAYPGEADTAATLAGSEYHGACAAQPVTTFSRGLLAGHLQEFHGCGGTATRVVFVAATIPGAPHTYLLLVQLTGAADDAAVLDGLLSSFSPIALPGA